MTKRILFTTTNLHLPGGGSEELWSQVASKMAVLDEFSVAALVNHWNPIPSHIKNFVENGGEVFYFPSESPIPPSKLKILTNRLLPSRYQFQPTYGKSKLHAIKEFDPELVIVSFGDLFQPSAVLDYLIEKNIAYMAIIQLVGEFSIKDDENIDKSSAYFQNSKLNCFLSRKNISLAEQLLGEHISNAIVVKNPCKIEPCYLDYPSTEDGFKLAFPARFHTLHKGLDILLKVMAQEKWKRRSLVVNCFGDGPNKKQLNRLRSLWDVDNVHFHPFKSDISDIWKNHHGLIMSSRMEGHPLVAIEAMACGRMIITTNVGAGDEFVTHGKDGFIADTATEQGLDAALEEAWLMRKNWREMGHSALVKAREFLETDPVCEMTSLIKTVI